MHTSPKKYQQLQAEGRMTIASLHQQRHSVRDIAQRLGRAPSTVSREFKRNSNRLGCYSRQSAHTLCQRRRQLARPVCRLHANSVLFMVVQHFLRQRWSPEQIDLTLARLYPSGHPWRVSHETYN